MLKLLHSAASAAACLTLLVQLFLEGTEPGLRAVNNHAIELGECEASYGTGWDIRDAKELVIFLAKPRLVQGRAT